MPKNKKKQVGPRRKYYFLIRKTPQADHTGMMDTYRCKDSPTPYSEELVVANVQSDQSDEVHSVIKCETTMESCDQVIEYETAMKSCEQVIKHETAMKSDEQVVEYDTAMKYCEQVVECETTMESDEQVVEYETAMKSCEQVVKCETTMESDEQVVEYETAMKSCEQVVECETTMESDEQVVEYETAMKSCEQVVKFETSMKSCEQVVKFETSMESCEQVENLSCFAHDHSYSYPYFDEMPSNTDTVDKSQACYDLLDSNMKKLEQLKNDIRKHLFSPYILTCREDGCGLQILELYKVEGSTSVKLEIDISFDLQVKLFVHRKELPNSHYLWDDLPKEFDEYSKLCLLLRKLQTFAVCMGNPDEQFQDLIPIGEVLIDNASVSHAYREGDFCAQIGDLQYHSTIRSVDCQLLAPGRRCNKCLSYRRNLWSRKQRLDENSKDVSTNLIGSKRKHRDMNKEMLITKIKQQQSCIKTLQSQVDRQRRELDQQTKQAETKVPNHQNGEMLNLINSSQGDTEINSYEGDIEKAFQTEECLQRLFWEQQIKYIKSGKNAMRWHPMIVRWCLNLRNKSSTAYNAIRDTGVINLPSPRTLFDHSHGVRSAHKKKDD